MMPANEAKKVVPPEATPDMPVKPAQPEERVVRVKALASDYDGTLAHNGVVTVETVASLRAFKDSGRRLLLVTGREMPDLTGVFPHLDLFDLIVAENGALLQAPLTGEQTALAPPPPEGFVDELQRRGVGPISVGAAIVATWEPHEKVVLDVIKERGLDLQITFNKGAVMILPTGVTKATGLAAALKVLQLEAKDVVGVGDAENDHAFLRVCGRGVAVANALDAVKETSDFVTKGARGEGVSELIGMILRDEERLFAPHPDPTAP